MNDEPAFEVLGQAAELLAGAAGPLMAAAQAQAAAAAQQQAASSQTPAWLTPPAATPTQAAQQQAQQQPAGGFPAWMVPQTPQQAAQQQAAMDAALQQAAARRAAQQQAAQQAQQQAAWAPTPAAPPLPLSQPAYVYGPQTPLQAAQQQAQQQPHALGGTPAWAQPQPPAPTPLQAAQGQLPPPTPQQQAQQAAAAGPTPGDLALAAARATPMPPQAGADVGGFAGALRGAAAGLLVMKYAAQQVEGAFLGMASKASPAAAAQYQGSFDLLSARIGSHILPALEEASRAIQGIARVVPDPSTQIGGVSIFERIFPQVRLGRQVMDTLGVDKPAESWAGLPMARQGGHEEAYDRLQNAAANLDPLQTEQLKIVNENLKEIKGLLQAGGNRGDRLEITFR